MYIRDVIVMLFTVFFAVKAVRNVVARRHVGLRRIRHCKPTGIGLVLCARLPSFDGNWIDHSCGIYHVVETSKVSYVSGSDAVGSRLDLVWIVDGVFL